MAEKTKIEWTDATWSPITGCSVVSPGCTNCYAMRLAGTRLKHHPSRAGLTREVNGNHVWTGEVRFNDEWLTQPLSWTRSRMIFVCAHGDLFHDSVSNEWIDQVFAVMALAPQHIFQVLTKRSKRMLDYFDEHRPFRIADQALIVGRHLPDNHPGFSRTRWKPSVIRGCTQPATWPLPNVWLGVSAEDQQRADERIPDLLATPAAIRWLSAEPLLGPMNIRPYLPNCYECGGSCGLRLATWPGLQRCERCGEDYGPETDPVISEGCPKCSGDLGPVCPDCGSYMVYQHPDTPCLDWVVAGGESGPGARPMHPDWVRSLRDQCAAAGVPFLFKQWGEWAPEAGAVDGWTIDDNPEISRFDHRDWYGDHYGEPYRPIWSDDRDDDTVSRIGKKRAGRLLDGVEHSGFPEVSL